MKKLSTVLAAVAALAFVSPAAATTFKVNIYGSGFSPKSVTVAAGDTVTWTNKDNADHQIVADKGSFVSAILKSNKLESYSFTFQVAGTYAYHDGLYPKHTGTITAKGAPATLTLAASNSIVTYGDQATISGVVSNHQAGESVTLFYRPYPQVSFLERTTVLTATGGTWTFIAQPQILTTYEATWKGAFSQAATIEVAPKISFTKTAAGYLVVRVSGGRSFYRRGIQFQRLSRYGQWTTIKLVLLGSGSGARFKPVLPKGISKLRMAFSVNQAGAGYLGTFSPVLVYRKA